MWLWELSWPVHIFAHVAIVFLLPSVLLGTISPVVAKMALDLGLPTGRTVGDIYAWGAAGSIAGTFFAGFYLIATMGTTAIIWTIGVVLLLMGILYWAKLWVLYIWAAIFIAFMTMGMAPAEWAANSGSALGLRTKPNPNIIYEDETQYCYVAVARISENPDQRAFMQDKLKHSEIVMGDILDLQYFYSRIYAAVTAKVSGNKNKLSTLTIGGGGYVFPRYIEKVWPGSRVDVAEIDPGVTEATINTITMDARNYVDDLVRKERDGGEIIRYDFIYEDAINDYSVPFQLVTKEFNDKIAKILKDDGAYMVNLIDIFDTGLFLGTLVNTLEQTFSYIHVISEPGLALSDRTTFVLIASKRELDLDDLAKEYKREPLELWKLNEDEMAYIKASAGDVILTDNYAPIENLMAPVVKSSAVVFLVDRCKTEARELYEKGRFEESLRKYEDLIRYDQTKATFAYNGMALIFARQGKLSQAAEAFRKALKANENAKIKSEVEGIHYSLGLLLKRMGKTIEAKEHLDRAADLFREGAAGKYANSPEIFIRLGDALAENGNLREASKAFAKAVALDPTNPAIRMRLIQSLEFQGRIKEAIVASQESYQFMNRHGQIDVAMQFKEYKEQLEYKYQKQK
jgi:tetratricopeptide (TPR) repeat protein